MAEYYFMSQLPSLDGIGDQSPLPITEERFLELCRRFLGKKAQKEIEHLTLAPSRYHEDSSSVLVKAWNEGGHPMTPVDTLGLARALSAGDLHAAQNLTHNDLEAPAISLMPEIGSLIERFRGLGASFVRMTGSGSTVFAAFESDEAALAAQAQVPGSIFTRTTAAI